MQEAKMERRPLGFVLQKCLSGERGDGEFAIVVARPPAHERIACGSWLTAVNQQSVHSLNYAEAMKCIEEAPLPVTLEFAPPRHLAEKQKKQGKQVAPVRLQVAAASTATTPTTRTAGPHARVLGASVGRKRRAGRRWRGCGALTVPRALLLLALLAAVCALLSEYVRDTTLAGGNLGPGAGMAPKTPAPASRPVPSFSNRYDIGSFSPWLSRQAIATPAGSAPTAVPADTVLSTAAVALRHTPPPSDSYDIGGFSPWLQKH